MKILHLNTSDKGGAAKAVYGFHRALKQSGHNSKILVFKKRELDDEDVIPFKLPVMGKLRRYFNEARRRTLFSRTKKEYNFFNTDESIELPLRYFLSNLPFAPDIICVHWVSGFVNAKTIHDLGKASGAPVLWRFNDMNAFTGGCHYNNGCANYFTGCGNCPALPNPSAKDLSWKNLQAKMKWLGKTNICFVSSTTEIDSELRSSALAKICATRKIMVACNSENFRPNDKSKAAKDLGLPADKRIIFFGAQNMNEPRKGFKELLEALRIVKDTLNDDVAKDVLLVYASREELPVVDWPFEHQRIPFFSEEAQLATAYQAAAVFVSPSLEDAGPMMIAEAMLCGTPVVAFDIGLAKDAIENNVSGFIAPSHDVDRFAAGISNILCMTPADAELMSDRCVDFARNLFSQAREMNEYSALFDELKNKQHV